MAQGGGRAPLLPLPKVSALSPTRSNGPWQQDHSSRAANYAVDASSFYNVAAPSDFTGGRAQGAATRGGQLQDEATGHVPQHAGQSMHGAAPASQNGVSGVAAGPAGVASPELAALLQKNLEALAGATQALNQLLLRVPSAVAAAAAPAAQQAVGPPPPSAAVQATASAPPTTATAAPAAASAGPATASAGPSTGPPVASVTPAHVGSAAALPAFGGPNGPIHIFFRFNIIDVMDVNTKAGDFRVYMYFEAAWAYETPEHGKKDWDPGIFFPEEKSTDAVKLEATFDDKAYDDKFGRKMKMWRFLGVKTFKQQFDLRAFPFDEHSLLINVRSRTSEGKDNHRAVLWFPNVLFPSNPPVAEEKNSASELWRFPDNEAPSPIDSRDPAKMALDDTVRNIRAHLLSPMYHNEVQDMYSGLSKKNVFGDIKDVRLETLDREWKRAPPGYLQERVILYEVGGLHAGKVFSSPQLAIKIKRKVAFFGWNVIFPIILIAVLAATGWIPPTCDIQTRLQNVLLMALTLVAFKLSISDMLPMVSYLTLLDRLFMFNLLLLSLIALEVCIAFSVLDDDGQAFCARREGTTHSEVDFYFAIFISPLWIGGYIYFWDEAVRCREGCGLPTYLLWRMWAKSNRRRKLRHHRMVLAQALMRQQREEDENEKRYAESIHGGRALHQGGAGGGAGRQGAGAAPTRGGGATVVPM